MCQKGIQIKKNFILIKSSCFLQILKEFWRCANAEILGFLKSNLGEVLFFRDFLRNCRRREHPEDVLNLKYKWN